MRHTTCVSNFGMNNNNNESQVRPSINDVTALGYRGFSDNSSKALALNDGGSTGKGVKNYQKLRDVIYGRPLTESVA
jgi:hypothetical protein